MVRVFVSWSGGKDSCLALYRAINSGLEIKFLFTMLGEDSSTSASHGLGKEVLDVQAKAIGIPIVYGKASTETYEGELKNIITVQKSRGVEGGVFGDINLQEHRDWIERVCGDIGVKPFFPLWNDDYERLLNEFIGNGFEAIIVSAKTDLITREWIGHAFDWEFIKYLETMGLDLLGEKGEFHTLVTNGPIFKERLRIIKFSKMVKNDQWVPEHLKVSID